MPVNIELMAATVRTPDKYWLGFECSVHIETSTSKNSHEIATRISLISDKPSTAESF